MRVFDLLRLMEPAITPTETKVHLATWNGEDNPLDVYLAGDFPEWQRWQTKRNFEKRFVLALIALPSPNKWLFGGAYTAAGCEERQSNYYLYGLPLKCKKLTEWGPGGRAPAVVYPASVVGSE
jgi:hypothetical protein